MNEDLKFVQQKSQNKFLTAGHQRESSLNNLANLSRGQTLRTQKTIQKSVKQLDTITSTFDFEQDKKLNKKSTAFFQSKIDETKFLKKSSETYFFEIFNKLKKKCPVLIPDTIFVGGGTFISWYFTSNKNGAILKRKSHKLNPVEVFKNYYRQSPISVDEDFNDRKVNQYLKNEQSTDDERNNENVSLMAAGASPLGVIQSTNDGFGGLQRRNSITKTQVFAFQQTLSINNQNNAALNTSGSVNEKVWTLKKILKEMSMKSVNQRMIEKYDNDLPYLAYVKFHSQKSRGFKPFEFYQLIHERLGEVKLIQTYIYTRIQQQPENQDRNFNQNQKEGKPSAIPIGGCYYCEYSHPQNIQPPQMIINKQQVSQDLLNKMHKDGIRILNTSLTTLIEEKTKVIVSYLENTIHIDVKRAYLKFLQDSNRDESINSQQNLPVQRLLNDSFVFGGNKLHTDKTKWRDSHVSKICYGDFCDFQFNDNHKFLSYRGKKKEFEKNFGLIPEKNKIFNNKFDFTVSGLIIKKIEDNPIVAEQILQKHCIVRKNPNIIASQENTARKQNNKTPIEDDQTVQGNNQKLQTISVQVEIASADNDLGMGLGNIQDPKSKSHIKFIRKRLYPDSLNQLYKAVTVCKTCFLIYSLLSDYFDELVKATISPDKNENFCTNPLLSHNKWTHSQKLLQKREEKPITFSQTQKINTHQNTPTHTNLAKSSGQKQYESKKSFIHKNLQSVEIANLKGSVLFKNTQSMIQIEGFQQQNSSLRQNESLKDPIFSRNNYNSQSILPQTININQTVSTKFNSTSGKFTRSAFGSRQPSFVKATESVKIREAQKFSYKFINSVDFKQNENKRNIQTIIQNGQKLGDRLYSQILDKQKSKISKDFDMQDLTSKSNKSNGKTPKRNRDTEEIKDLKGTLNTAFASLFKKTEEKYYLQRAKKNQSEKRKIINFFNEVSKDVNKYQLVQKSQSTMDNRRISIISSNKPSIQWHGRQNSVLDEWQNDFQFKKIDDQNGNSRMSIINNSPEKTMISLALSKNGSPVSKQSQQFPLQQLLLDINKNKEIQDSRRRTVLSPFDQPTQENNNNIPPKANFAFQSSLQTGIMSLAQKMISQQINFLKEETQEKEKEQSRKNSQQIGTQEDNQNKKQTRKIRLSILSTTKKRKNPNITTSVFHHQNLQHIKSVPFYRISTPKAPFYSNEIAIENAPDDKYIIPIENYKTMNIEQYSELLGIDKDTLQDCGIFFINEFTSMIYSIIENSQDQGNNSQSSFNLAGLQKSSIINKPTTVQAASGEPTLGLFSGLRSALAATKTQTEEQTPRLDQQNQQPLPVNANNISASNMQSPSPMNFMSRLSLQQNQRKKVFHNYIVIMDTFDSFVDKMDFFEKISQQSSMPSRFILVNLPGQLYTQYNFKRTDKQPLNNSFYSNCLDLLLFHLHEKNMISCLFEPYSIIGFGNGANIALYYALQVNDTNDNLRSILLFNGFCYVDQMLKDTINSAIDNFKKCPHDMSQMGDFYFQNLILSSDIVQRNIMKQLIPKDETVLSEGENNKFHDKQNDLIMQVKLKLMNNSVDTTNNNYSNQAIHNLDLRNKIDLCKGILANISIQEKLKYLKMPIIYVYSKKNCFIPLKHSDIIQKVSSNNLIMFDIIEFIKE
eukprot:403366282